MTFTKVAQKFLKILSPESGFSKKFVMKVFELPNGLRETFFIDREKDSVQILCITKEAEVVLVEQFRPGIERTQIELPGGGIEEGEDPLNAGIRELKEECGMLGDATYMGFNFYSPYSSGKRHSVLVINAEKTSNQNLDPNEFVEVLTMPLRDFRRKIKDGKIRGWDFAYRALDYIGKL